MYTKSKGKQERDWSVQPYSLADVEIFPTFVSKLEDHLTDKDGILRLLWNANSDEDLQLMTKIRRLEYAPKSPKVSNPLDAEGDRIGILYFLFILLSTLGSVGNRDCHRFNRSYGSCSNMAQGSVQR